MADPVSWAIAALSAGAELAAVESEKATLEGQARVKDVAAGAAEAEAGMKEEMLLSQQQRQFGELRDDGLQRPRTRVCDTPRSQVASCC